MLDGEEPAGARVAALHLVDDEHDAVVVADTAYAFEELGRCDDKAAFALYRLDDDRCDVLGRDGRDERALERCQCLGRAWAAIVLRERHPVDLGRERSEPGFVGMRLGRQGQGQQRATVKASLEADHGWPLRVGARKLDCVLDGFRARIEERGFRGAGDRRGLDQALGERDVRLIGDDREVGMEEAPSLLLHRFDDVRMRVTDGEAADSAGEVEKRVAVNIFDHRAF